MPANATEAPLGRRLGEVTNEYEFVVIGSESILGPIPNPPAELTMSIEAETSIR